MAYDGSRDAAPQPDRPAEYYANQRSKGGGVKTILFLAGAASGILLAKNWRVVTKEGIKAGIRIGRKVKEISQQAVDEVEDVAAEALDELPDTKRGERV